jgi:hypothetical protein
MAGVKLSFGFVLGARAPELSSDIGLHGCRSGWVHQIFL